MHPLRLEAQTSEIRLVPRTGQQTTPGARSDKELLEAAVAGAAAFGEFYDRHVESVLSYFWHRTRDHEVTADLTSETFAVALENINKFDPNRGDGAQWVHGIAANLLKKFWRRNRVTNRAQSRLEMTVSELSIEAAQEIEATEAALDASRLHKALARVPSKNRQAVHLRVIEQMSYDQIADRLQCKTSTARMRVLRGLRRLQDEFDHPSPKNNQS